MLKRKRRLASTNQQPNSSVSSLNETYDSNIIQLNHKINIIEQSQKRIEANFEKLQVQLSKLIEGQATILKKLGVKCKGNDSIPELNKDNVDNVYYAVKLGHKPGIYTSKAEYLKQIRNYRGAQSNMFLDLQTAKDYVGTEIAKKNNIKQVDNSKDTIETKGPKKPEEFAISFFSDGSCKGHLQGNTKTCETGWAFKMIYPLRKEDKIDFYELGHKTGKVTTNMLSPFYLGADQTTSTSAELTAIVEIFKFLLKPGDKLAHLLKPSICSKIKIFTDSKFVLKVINKEINPSNNKGLVSNALNWKKQLEEKGYQVEVQWIKGHINLAHHDEVDKLAGEVKVARDRFFEKAQAVKYITSHLEVKKSKSSIIDLVEPSTT